MALDSNQLIAGIGLEMHNQFVKHPIALGCDGGFARLKPKLLHQITEADSGFSGDILDLGLALRRNLRRETILRLLEGLRDRYGLWSMTLHPEAITLENARDRFCDQRRGRSVFNRQNLQFAHDPLRKASPGPNDVYSNPRPDPVFSSTVQIDDIPLRHHVHDAQV